MTMIADATHLAGYLVWCDPSAQTRLDLEESHALFCLEARTLWFQHYVYETTQPIPSVDDPRAMAPYDHQVLICWGHHGLLALGVRHHVIDHLLAHELAVRSRNPWRKATIDVNSLIARHLAFSSAPPTTEPRPPLCQYEISAVAAKTESYRGLLRSISLYGDNVVHTPVLKSLGPLECTSCTLRNDTGEVLSFGSDGYISFRVPKEGPPQILRLREIMAILGVLRDANLLIL
jgi:hypothetical protein